VIYKPREVDQAGENFREKTKGRVVEKEYSLGRTRRGEISEVHLKKRAYTIIREIE